MKLFTDKVAIKIVDRSRLDTKNLRMLSREVATLESVQHPYILRLFEGKEKIYFPISLSLPSRRKFILYLVIETLGRVHLVTEFIQGGELYYRIVQKGVFTENKAVKIFKQIVLAVQHMVSVIFIKFICRLRV